MVSRQGNNSPDGIGDNTDERNCPKATGGSGSKVGHGSNSNPAASSIPNAQEVSDQAPSLNLKRAIIPVVLGLAVVGWMLWKDFDPAVFDDIHFGWNTVFWLFMAVIFIFGRDIGYIIRIRVLSNGTLSWRQAFRIIMLWEFTSAITPSAVGGTSFAILYVHKEGISIGRSSAMVMLTSFLDELYFIVMFPLMMLVVGFDNLFYTAAQEGVVATGLMAFAITGYCLKLSYLLIVSYGLFINPRGLKWLLMKIFRLRVLRKWYRSVNDIGTDIINCSKEIKTNSSSFWVKSLSSTFLSWSSRYLVANALILAFFSVSDQVLLFARQLTMWIMMLIMPTPGGSGFAELIFTTYCSDLILVPTDLQAGAAALIALLWRGITYYPYLLIGAIIFPRWIARSFGKRS